MGQKALKHRYQAEIEHPAKNQKVFNKLAYGGHVQSEKNRLFEELFDKAAIDVNGEVCISAISVTLQTAVAAMP